MSSSTVETIRNIKICLIIGKCAQLARGLILKFPPFSIKDLSPEAIKLGYDFLIAMQEKDNEKALEIITKIEKLHSIWRNE